MAFPKLGATLTVEHKGAKVTGKMTKIRPVDQTVFIESGGGMGTWVPMSAVRAKYGE